MAIGLVARRMTLASALYGIWMTPFAVVFAGVLSHWPILMVVALLMGAMFFAGVPLGPLRWQVGQKEIFIGTFFIVGLWCVATLLTLNDYLKYRGWSLADDEWDEVIGCFMKALVAGTFAEAYQSCSKRIQEEYSLDEFESEAKRRVGELGQGRHPLLLNKPGTFRLPILAGALPLLGAVADPETAAVALILMEGFDGIPDRKRVPTLRLKLKQGPLGMQVDDFDMTVTSLNQWAG